jgi:predicted glycoside hydrolase/deacetylase ChbG (UPF0249 family)
VRRLIVNADDFGLSDGVNAGIVRAHREGIVTSASLMVRQPGAEAAVNAARSCPDLSVGLHLDLGEWERRDGDWHPRYAWVDDSDAAAVTVEVERQLTTFRALVGRDPTHLDSHQHVHRDEPTRSILESAALSIGVPLRHESPIRYYGGFYGQSNDGSPCWNAIGSAALAELVAALPVGTTELCCHPGEQIDPSWDYGVERTIELESLCHARVRAAIEESGVRLESFDATVASCVEQ